MARFCTVPRVVSPVGVFSHFLGPIFGVPQLLGWVRGWVRVGANFLFGVSRAVCLGVSLGVSQGVSLRVRLVRRRGGGGFLALVNILKVFMGGLGGEEEKVAGNLIERDVAWVLHLDNARLPPVDTAHGAHLHAP